MGFGGRALQKQISVFTNDPANATVTLTVAGEVEVFATLTPQVLRLSGAPEQDLSGEVIVTASDKYDFEITGVSTQNQGNVAVALAPADSGKKSWRVTVKNLKKDLGRYYETVALKTDSPIQKEILIRVFGNILREAAKQADAP
jgi:hypothetical protein